MKKLMLSLALALVLPACGKKTPPPANAGDTQTAPTGEPAGDTEAPPPANPCEGATVDPCSGGEGN